MKAYRWEVAPSNPDRVSELQEAQGVSRACAVALAHRGITPADIRDYLFPELGNLVDPYALPGTREAAARLWQAVQKGENILIHGDYDTDGITSAYLLSKVLSQNGARIEAFLPHRIDDGYGLTPESIDKACCEHHSLLITVDCGITSLEAVDAANRLGIDVIVTDHHEPGGQLPAAKAVIDPKLPGADPRIIELAGVGVAFKVCHAFIKYGQEEGLGGFATDLKDVLDLVALGTVADIVPLLQENRILVRHGLERLSCQHRPGIRALCEIAGLNDRITAPDIAFRLAPRLNASGRMGDPTLSMKLLQVESVTEAYPLAEALDEQNRRRQQLEAEVFAEAEEQIEYLTDLECDHSIVAWGENWHQGVLGIVAARMVRRYHRPCVILTRDATGCLSGSGRSVTGVNLVEVLDGCKDLLVRFGGHPMAAGVSLHREHINVFSRRFDRLIRDALAGRELCPQLDICGEISLAEIDSQFLEELSLMQPFGQANPEPVFLSRNLSGERLMTVGRGHTRGALYERCSGIELNFIAFDCLPSDLPAGPWDVVYKPQWNHFNGRSMPQAQVLDVRPAGA